MYRCFVNCYCICNLYDISQSEKHLRWNCFTHQASNTASIIHTRKLTCLCRARIIDNKTTACVNEHTVNWKILNI